MRIILAPAVSVALAAAGPALADVRGCYDAEEALEILAEMGAAHVRAGLGGMADGTPEWWDLPGGGWVLTMITDKAQSRCIVDHGQRGTKDEGLPAYLFLKDTRARQADPEIVR